MNLVKAAENGLTMLNRDSKAGTIDRLFEAHHRELYQFARRLSRTRDEARDLVQEAFVRLVQTKVPLLTEDHVRGWLYRTLMNLCHDQRRRSAVRSRYQDARQALQGVDDLTEARLVARMAVERALLQLDIRRRAVVVLHEIQGESVGDIARLLDIAPVTVRWHLSRARRLLTKILTPK